MRTARAYFYSDMHTPITLPSGLPIIGGGSVHRALAGDSCSLEVPHRFLDRWAVEAGQILEVRLGKFLLFRGRVEDIGRNVNLPAFPIRGTRTVTAMGGQWQLDKRLFKQALSYTVGTPQSKAVILDSLEDENLDHWDLFLNWDGIQDAASNCIGLAYDQSNKWRDVLDDVTAMSDSLGREWYYRVDPEPPASKHWYAANYRTTPLYTAALHGFSDRFCDNSIHAARWPSVNRKKTNCGAGANLTEANNRLQMTVDSSDGNDSWIWMGQNLPTLFYQSGQIRASVKIAANFAKGVTGKVRASLYISNEGWSANNWTPTGAVAPQSWIRLGMYAGSAETGEYGWEASKRINGGAVTQLYHEDDLGIVQATLTELVIYIDATNVTLVGNGAVLYSGAHGFGANLNSAYIALVGYTTKVAEQTWWYDDLQAQYWQRRPSAPYLSVFPRDVSSYDLRVPLAAITGGLGITSTLQDAYNKTAVKYDSSYTSWLSPLASMDSQEDYGIRMGITDGGTISSAIADQINSRWQGTARDPAVQVAGFSLGRPIQNKYGALYDLYKIYPGQRFIIPELGTDVYYVQGIDYDLLAGTAQLELEDEETLEGLIANLQKKEKRRRK